MPFLTILAALAARIGKTVLLGLLTEKIAVRLILWAVSTLASKTSNKWDDATVEFLRQSYIAGGGDPVAADPIRFPVIGEQPTEPPGAVDPAVYQLQQMQLPLDERPKE